MKTLYIVLVVLALALCIFAGTLVMELRKENDLQQVTIDGLRKENEANEQRHKHAVDSITKIQVIQADSTRYYRLLKTKDQQTVKTKTESHEKIVFHNLNDSARHSKLAKFFRSYVHP